MITINKQNEHKTKAVGLISGGLDSTLAAKLIHDQNIEVHGVYFAMPWGCCDKQNAVKIADQIGIKLIVLQLDERYLEIVKKPKFGYGAAMNPCIDCRIHMFQRAAQYMKHIKADFVFTGEVIGQRPMSQKRQSMENIEKATGLQGRLLRPLCAQLFEPTIPEIEGLVNREKLLAVNGRSRKDQQQLAEQFDITDYTAPAGGCNLTQANFAVKMQDTLKYGYRNFRETISLKWGRHFRLSPDFKAILGRNHEENHYLIQYAHQQDTIMEVNILEGPTAIIKGENPGTEILKLTSGIIRRYTRHKNEPSLTVKYWKAGDKNNVTLTDASIIPNDLVESLHIKK